MLNEQAITQADPVLLRYKEAQYLYVKFEAACGPPRDSYFEMIVYFDAFLFCFVSIEEMVSKEIKEKLNDLDVFKFLKAARNVTTHHSVLAAPNQKGEFVRPFFRAIDESKVGNASARLRIDVEQFGQIFSLAAELWPCGKKVFQAGAESLRRIEASGGKELFIEDVMGDGLQAISKMLGYEA